MAFSGDNRQATIISETRRLAENTSIEHIDIYSTIKTQPKVETYPKFGNKGREMRSNFITTIMTAVLEYFDNKNDIEENGYIFYTLP